MSTPASALDPEIQAAFSGAPTPADPSHGDLDPEIQQAFGKGKTPKSVGETEDAQFGLKGTGEALLHYGSAAAAGTLAAGASLGALATAPWGKKISTAKSAIEDIENKLTFQPKSEEGKAAVAAADTPLGYPGRLANRAVQAITGPQGTENPGLAATASTAIQAVPALLGLGAAKVLGPGAEVARRSAQEVADATVANSPQSQGSAAAAPNLATASPELRQAVVEAAQKTGGAVNPTALTRQAEADQFGIRLTEGQATGDSSLISRERNTRGANNAYVDRYNEQNKNLVGAMQDLREQVGPDVFSTNPVEHGDTLIEAYKTKDAAAKADISAKYKALEDANGGHFPVDGVQLADNVDAVLSKKMKAPFLPSGVRTILNGLRDGEPMSFENFENLRTTLAAESRKAERSGDGNAAAAVNLAREQVEALPMSGGSAGMKALADQARSAAKARFDALREDPAYNAAVNDTVSPDRFTQRFITGPSATRDGVALMKQNLSHDPVASQTMGVAALDHLRDSARITPMGEGTFTQAGFNKQLQALGPRLKSVVDPQAAEKLDTLGRVARYTQEQPAGAFVNNSNTLVGALAEHAKTLGTTVLDTKTLGAATPIRKMLQKRAEKKAVEQSLAPGAGLTRLSDVAGKP